ncbi:GNAT family N-acetyltransferase [Pseudoalteromonas obscura]|uniref:GNAT family N-acetyltransferase n=1 Tax=Pseudoalteromonas TaxID=53246 RepID=UPI001FFD5BC4|nr:GNAT family N-acetyltransferase [Pseudoalteromonas luteoviolacea]
MIKLTQLSRDYFSQVISLGNLVHGDNYLDSERLEQIYQMGLKKSLNASFVAIDESNQVIGFRLTYCAEQWPIDKWCTPADWPVDIEQMAYFKCIAIDPRAQGQGIGPKLLAASIEVLKKQGAKAGVAHLWQQSPGNGAVKYFTKSGGKLIKLHDDRWLENCINDGYECPICGNECHCQAAEMVIEFT